MNRRLDGSSSPDITRIPSPANESGVMETPAARTAVATANVPFFPATPRNRWLDLLNDVARHQASPSRTINAQLWFRTSFKNQLRVWTADGYRAHSSNVLCRR